MALMSDERHLSERHDPKLSEDMTLNGSDGSGFEECFEPLAEISVGELLAADTLGERLDAHR